MTHKVSKSDNQFERAVLDGSFEVASFDHRAHLRLAYIFTAGASAEQALPKMRSALVAYLDHHNVDASKYHETITRAWILAVRHFLELSEYCSSADDFLEQHPQLLDPNIMLTHYSSQRLFSEQARRQFMPADIQAIPEYTAPAGIR